MDRTLCYNLQYRTNIMDINVILFITVPEREYMSLLIYYYLSFESRKIHTISWLWV